TEKLKPMEQQGFARYLGPKTVTELIDCFDAGAAVVHFPFEEAFGLVVAEALARGLQFFCAELSGIKDNAGDAPGAALFEVDDWSGLTSGIANWLGQGSPRPKEAMRLMRECYHPQVIARRHLEIYQEVLKAGRHG